MCKQSIAGLYGWLGRSSFLPYHSIGICTGLMESMCVYTCCHMCALTQTLYFKGLCHTQWRDGHTYTHSPSPPSPPSLPDRGIYSMYTQQCTESQRLTGMPPEPLYQWYPSIEPPKHWTDCIKQPCLPITYTL